MGKRCVIKRCFSKINNDIDDSLIISVVLILYEISESVDNFGGKVLTKTFVWKINLYKFSIGLINTCTNIQLLY